jgi:protoporphyrinogen oxidase
VNGHREPGSRGSSEVDVVIVGAGPAGLTAAWELARRGRRPLVLEASGSVGGIARTEKHDGHRFDIGGHRFLTKVPEIQALWREMLGDDLRLVARRSRIYSQGRFFNYPLEFLDALGSTGVAESVRILLSYLAARVRPHRNAFTFEEWVVNRFGRRLYETFFRGYTEKVWGIPCSRLSADWAAQRIRSVSLYRAVANAIFGNHREDSLVDRFRYPVLGPGMMWERFRDRIDVLGGTVRLHAPVVCVRHLEGAVSSVVVAANGNEQEIRCRHLISSMPIGDLVRSLDPPPERPVLDAAGRLRYRALIVVGLIVGRGELFPDQWIYVHDREVRVGRIQNFKNWSLQMCPSPDESNLGLEYFCDEGDEIWSLGDDELVALATRELEALGLAGAEEVNDGVVFRQPRAYPVYDRDYRSELVILRDHLGTLENLHTVGRNGMHRYNNQDHSMVTALHAVGSVFGEDSDAWSVNIERSYHESSAIPMLREESPEVNRPDPRP